MRLLLINILGSWLLLLPASLAAGPFDYDFELSYERSALDGRTLGDDRTGDRFVEEELEFEISLEYQVNNDLYLFFTGALVDDSETLETSGADQSINGFERREMGVGYFFGEAVDSVFIVGRSEFVSASEWWVWWDEELDAVRLESAYGNFEVLAAVAEELARENSQDDFIDPELKDVRRVLFSLAWEFVPQQTLTLYHLDQSDRSSGYRLGEIEDIEKIDDEDADLDWTGISYQGEFDSTSAGLLAIELHAARVSGNETIYEFGDPENGSTELEDIFERDVSGIAYGFLLGWTPAQLDSWTLVIGGARGDGDSNPDSSRDNAFRGNNLEGDSESFGELYRPELSNLDLDLIGVAWQINAETELALYRYDYQQRELAEEMRDVAIDLDLTGNSRDLGSEIDLVLTIETGKGLELILTAAEFDPGKAYGSFSNETASYFNVEIVYEF